MTCRSVFLPMFAPRRLAGVVLLGVAALLFADSGRAETGATTAGRVFTGRLVQADEAWNLAFESPEGRMEVPVRELAYWGRLRDSVRATETILADGSVLAGDVLDLTRDQLVVDTSLWPGLGVPLRQVRAVIFQPPVDAGERDRLRQRIDQAAGLDDRVLLVNGDEIRGRIGPSNGATQLFGLGTLHLETQPGAEPVPVAVENVVAAIFSPALAARQTRPRDVVLLGMQDGSYCVVQELTLTPAGAQLLLAGGLRLTTRWETLLAALVFIQPDAGQLTWLSDLSATAYRQIPFSQLEWPLGLDRNVLGGRLRYGDAYWRKGIGMHSASRVVFALDGTSQRFQAELALDRTAGRQGSVVGWVYLERPGEAGELAWQPVDESPVIRGGDPPHAVDVDIRGAARIMLMIDFADYGDQRDYANWLHARLLP